MTISAGEKIQAKEILGPVNQQLRLQQLDISELP
jgi:hypothetical protein